MDNLQYYDKKVREELKKFRFKPYYKWITFNTLVVEILEVGTLLGFKPYYKWITFNTKVEDTPIQTPKESFKPYYKWITFNTKDFIHCWIY